MFRQLHYQFRPMKCRPVSDSDGVIQAYELDQGKQLDIDRYNFWVLVGASLLFL